MSVFRPPKVVARMSPTYTYSYLDSEHLEREHPPKLLLTTPVSSHGVSVGNISPRNLGSPSNASTAQARGICGSCWSARNEPLRSRVQGQPGTITKRFISSKQSVVSRTPLQTISGNSVFLSPADNPQQPLFEHGVNKKAPGTTSFRNAREEDHLEWVQATSVSISSNPGSPCDPFDSLPIGSTARVCELIRSYLDAYMMPSLWERGREESLKALQSYRKTCEFPMVLRSKTALSSLVAFLEASEAFIGDNTDSPQALSSIQIALSTVQQDLYDAETAFDDSTTWSVAMLMVAAHRMRDRSSWFLHAEGLKAILERRTSTQDSADDHYIRRQSGFLPLKGCGCPQCMTCPDDKPVQDSRPLEKDEEVRSSHQPITRATALVRMIDQGFISASLESEIEQTLTWLDLNPLIRRDAVAFEATATHFFADGCFKCFFGPQTKPLDVVLRSLISLILYQDVRNKPSCSCITIRRVVHLATMTLKALDVGDLLQTNPDFLLWVALTIGPLSRGEARFWWSNLSVQLADTFCTWDVKPVLQLLPSSFFWSSTLDSTATAFWEESIALHA